MKPAVVARGAVFVDTGAWIAMQDRRDAHHAAVADALFSNKSRLITTDYVLDETLTFLRLRVNHAQAVRFGEYVTADTNVTVVRVSDEDWQQAWKLFVAFPEQNFSFTDCTSFAIMRRLGLSEAFTLDRHFRAMGFDVAPGTGGGA
jgi:predicted nucleic acid-binding protein